MDRYDLMMTEGCSCAARIEGMVVLPHLEGAACPEFDPAPGLFFMG
jgi:hypothetical protein